MTLVRVCFRGNKVFRPLRTRASKRFRKVIACLEFCGSLDLSARHQVGLASLETTKSGTDYCVPVGLEYAMPPRSVFQTRVRAPRGRGSCSVVMMMMHNRESCHGRGAEASNRGTLHHIYANNSRRHIVNLN
jgi:hypothetical protein